MYQARIHITLKPTVNDPQGVTVLSSLHRLGFNSAGDVRVGKFLLVNIDATDRAKAEVAVTEMCQKLLANPVIEDFTFDLEEISASKSAP
ncbi:MAG TPA: phosphoribosylformylglycinamidine synthase subunit PurS [Dehalococcoidia bacterium]|jgi:phosphoribosylformylglycinamidine synthase|nr:phosphoribosylformylglycinamidine synthase subunit PurS [Dehalococcoidia bacterium]